MYELLLPLSYSEYLLKGQTIKHDMAKISLWPGLKHFPAKDEIWMIKCGIKKMVFICEPIGKTTLRGIVISVPDLISISKATTPINDGCISTITLRERERERDMRKT